MSQRPVLGALALGETREALALDQCLEVRGLLVGFVGGRVIEHFVEQEVGRVFQGAVDLEELCAGLLAGLQGEASEDVGDGIALAVAGFPERGDGETAGDLRGLHGGPPVVGNGEDVGNLRARISGEWFGAERRVAGPVPGCLRPVTRKYASRAGCRTEAGCGRAIPAERLTSFRIA